MNSVDVSPMRPESRPDIDPAMEHARRTMRESGCGAPEQQMGSRWSIGCVALEITQRCNLDCTLCYLSENSEAVRDIPLQEIFRRIDLIRSHYGPNTDVQITGGEPTLRPRDQLLAIVRRVRALEMRPTLMTNGRRTTRDLLEALADAGLMDVVFHVDTTQQLKGYHSEVELNALRADYIDRCRGLPLSVMFNTTVHEGNFHEIPALVRFLKTQAGRVRTAAFHAQARIGRGIHEKTVDITLEAIATQIEKGAETAIDFSSSLVGHARCNRYGLCFAAGGKLFDALDDANFVARLQAATAAIVFDRSGRGDTLKRLFRWLVAHPKHWASVVSWCAIKAWHMRTGLVAGRGRVDTLSFLIHGFMDAGAIEQERIDACVFKTMTADGPISMCLHNARRDSFILQPIRIQTPRGERLWHPLGGIAQPRGRKHVKARPQREFVTPPGTLT